MYNSFHFILFLFVFLLSLHPALLFIFLLWFSTLHVFYCPSFLRQAAVNGNFSCRLIYMHPSFSRLSVYSYKTDADALVNTHLPVRCSSGPPCPPCSSDSPRSVTPLGTEGIFRFSCEVRITVSHLSRSGRDRDDTDRGRGRLTGSQDGKVCLTCF